MDEPLFLQMYYTVLTSHAGWLKAINSNNSRTATVDVPYYTSECVDSFLLSYNTENCYTYSGILWLHWWELRNTKSLKLNPIRNFISVVSDHQVWSLSLAMAYTNLLSCRGQG